MTTVVFIAAIAVLCLFALGIFALVLGIFLLHKLERFLKGHKTTLNTIEMVAGLIPLALSLRKAFTTKTK